MHESTFLILCALATEPLHGYGIVQAAGTLSAGRVHLRPGTLYTALDRLTRDGSLAVDREEVVDGRLRRYYRLTADGHAALEQEVARMEATAAVARRRLARRTDPRPA